MDYSKATSLHRLYGHMVFTIEAVRVNKDLRFIHNICSALGCTEMNVRYRTPMVDTKGKKI